MENIKKNNNYKNQYTIEEELYTEMGSRKLTKKEIERIRYIIDPIYNSILSYEIMDNATRKIIYMAITEDIRFESVYKTFEKIEATPSTLKIIENTYKNPEKARKLNLLHIILTTAPDTSLDRKTANQIEKNLKEILEGNPYQDMIIVDHNTNISYINNTRLKRIEQITHHEINGKDYSKTKIIINAAITKLTVYDNPLDEDPRQFKATFTTNHRKIPLIIGPLLTDEIIEFLIDSGYVEARYKVKDILPAIFNKFLEKNKATTKNKIEYPGFYHNKNTNTITNIDYPLQEPTKKELQKALNILEEFTSYFKGEKTKVAHILKWGLISPFIFAIKQKGRWINHLYLYGKAGSGKTTLADMVLYLWDAPNSDKNDIGGSSFNTEARIGERLKQFTFPIVVNEPQGVFEKPGIIEMIKSSIERTNSRGKFIGRGYKNIVSLSPVIYTSNHILPNDDALIRRMDCISFTHNERKSEQQKETFQRTFNMENHTECQLHQLKPLARYFAQEIITNPTYLDMDWKELTNIIINRAYIETDQKTPPWLLQWNKTETLEDMDETTIETIREFLIEEVNHANQKITVYDENGRRIKDNLYNTVNTKTTENFKGRLWQTLNERTIPYLTLTTQDNIYISRGFIDKVKQAKKIEESLKSISELLKWKYSVIKIGKELKSTRVIKVSFDNFLKFIYPSYEE